MAHVTQEKWSSGTAFLLAAVGSAVGLGNIWRFPYVVGENGGGAFVLIYLAIVFIFGIPLIMTELVIGRRKQLPPISAFETLSEGKKSRPWWRFVGFTYITVPIGILGFYFVIAGWTLNYVFGMVVGKYSSMTSTETQVAFDTMTANPYTLIFWMSISVAITAFVVSRGIKQGLEKSVNVLMPALFIILVILVMYSVLRGGVAETVDFMFSTDMDKITGTTVLEAMGQAFFSLSLGSASMMVYGSYLPKDVSIPKMACGVALADTFVAIVAGFAIFPIVLSSGIESSGGPGLVFVSLPVIFNDMPFGQIFGILFFLLLAFAAITSTISLFEPVVSSIEEKGIMSRKKASIVAGIGVWSLSAVAALSYNVLSDWHPLTFTSALADRNFSELLDYLAANAIMLFNALFAAIFVGWIMNRKDVLEELGLADSYLFKFWRMIVKVAIPLAIGYLLLDFLNVI